MNQLKDHFFLYKILHKILLKFPKNEECVAIYLKKNSYSKTLQYLEAQIIFYSNLLDLMQYSYFFQL